MTGWLARMLAEPRFEWPVVLTELSLEERGLCRGIAVVRLRPLRLGDAAAWRSLRVAEEARLAQWDATLPPGSGEGNLSFSAYVRDLRRQARDGTAMPFVIEVDGDFAGQVSVEPIVWSSMRSATLGYWLGSRWEGRGVMTLCVAMLLDHLLGPEVGLHRVEVNIRPENGPSLAVVRKLRLREEGTRLRYMHVAGRWADHRSFAATAEEVGAGYVQRLERAVVPLEGGEPQPN
ncbi:Putative ribosomal N-acetyltransferase YdaF [Actinomyces bovis]|uniref:Ribosomal N-acetyltransferase YdaF n=1 Tax=Actinomyces bovis TaxID=1658 RepID=A0ABY1VQ16_9ACTO|nr:GNAT family protein [Actinomyces bovis]SPT54225.1 Putative ribosomal N-acetyltransferase YdaF [Actinomyces bovis]VEG56504.1 Putative ribosomal N-acetyltransferase YdaF [Actinomyces israelii]